MLHIQNLSNYCKHCQFHKFLFLAGFYYLAQLCNCSDDRRFDEQTADGRKSKRRTIVANRVGLLQQLASDRQRTQSFA